MQIGKFNLKPFMITLPDEQKWIDNYQKAKNYLESQGINDCEYVQGIHAAKFGIDTSKRYTLDVPYEANYYIGQARVGGYLSYYMLTCIWNVLPDQYFFVLENDVNFVNNWKIELEKALNACSDFDFMFVGSCCTEGKNPIKIGNSNVYEYIWWGKDKWDWYPQCGHALIVNKKCIPYLIKTQRYANSVDQSLIKYSFPNLKVVAILPRLADQVKLDGSKTNLPI